MRTYLPSNQTAGRSSSRSSYGTTQSRGGQSWLTCLPTPLRCTAFRLSSSSGRYWPNTSAAAACSMSSTSPRREESVDAPEFAETLGTTLRDGTFRLVLVLDQAPDDL